MAEYKEVMGEDWARSTEIDFGEAPVFKALDVFFIEQLQNGFRPVVKENNPMPFIKAVANITEDQIQIWVRKMALTDIKNNDEDRNNPLRSFEVYHEFAKKIKAECRAILNAENFVADL